MATAMLAMLPPVAVVLLHAALVREGPGGDREVEGPLLLALGLVAVTAVVGSVTAAGAGMIARSSPAHRGGALLGPENSLLALPQRAGPGRRLPRAGRAPGARRRGGRDPRRHARAHHHRRGPGAASARSRSWGALRLKDRGGAALEERIPTLDQVVALAAGRASGRSCSRSRPTSGVSATRRSRRRCSRCSTATGFTPFTVVMAFEGATWRRVRQLLAPRRGWPRSTRRARCRPPAVTPSSEALRQAGVAFVGLDQALVNAGGRQAVRGWPASTLGVWTVNERARRSRASSSKAWRAHHRPPGPGRASCSAGDRAPLRPGASIRGRPAPPRS